MDWLQGMNQVVEYIEETLTENIRIDSLSRIVGCSVYEFSRIFSFMAGMSISEYIRRRRLSQAVFDIQNGNERLVDIALKYCYESQATFSRAFKELHGQTPLSACKKGISLKTYPKITFKLIIKGVVEMDFRIEKRDSFKIIGYKCKDDFNEWHYFKEHYHKQLRNENYYKTPLWQVGAYKYNVPDGEKKCIIGAELRDEPILDGMDIETFPAATWAVFPVIHDPANDATGKTYARVLAEWFPLSAYKRNEAVPYLEVYNPGNADLPENQDEVWVPVLKK